MTTSNLPEALRVAPWVPARKKKKLSPPSFVSIPPRIVWWSETEAEEWKDPYPAVGPDRDIFTSMSQEDRDAVIAKGLTGAGILPVYAGRHLSRDGLLRALRESSPHFIQHYRILEIALAKLGLEVIPLVTSLFEQRPSGFALESIRRIDSFELALNLAQKQFLSICGYPEHYPETTARVVLQLALSGNAKEAKSVKKVIDAMVSNGQTDLLFATAKAWSEDAVEELTAYLAPPPLPPKPPKLPSFFDVETLPRPKLSLGSDLTNEQLERFGQLLALLPLEAARAAVTTVRDACDKTSLSDFGRALLDRWVAADAPTSDKWVLVAAGLIGDDLVAHQIADRVAAWCEEGQHTRVAAGVEALGDIGSDVALMRLARFAEKSKSKPLKTRAQAAIDAFREDHDLSEDELGDRLVSDLGLDARGSLRLDYGGRSFTVHFGDTLEPVLREGDRAIKSLPKMKPDEDAAMVDRAQAIWQTLKTESKALIEAQRRRLERAMARRRRWSAVEHEAYFVQHPLMQHFARRVVWGMFDGDGVLSATFRMAEDGTLASIDDEQMTLATGSRVGIIHPLELTPEVCSTWGTVLADYGIVQPFPQLARETFVLDPNEKTLTELTRFEGSATPGARFFSLRHRGWEFIDYHLGKRVSNNRAIFLETTPGLQFLAQKPEDQTLGKLKIQGGTFGDLHPIEVSEALRDVALLRA